MKWFYILNKVCCKEEARSNVIVKKMFKKNIVKRPTPTQFVYVICFALCKLT